MADDLRLYLRAVEAIDWTKVQTQQEEEHHADWFLVDHKVLMYAGTPEDQTIEFLKRAPAAIRQLIAEVEAWRERAETAETAVEHARRVCYKAMAEKDAPGQWLVAQKVLAAIEEPSNLPPETPAKEET